MKITDDAGICPERFYTVFYNKNISHRSHTMDTDIYTVYTMNESANT